MDIEDFLNAYDVPADIIQNFTLNGITKEILHKITPELLKELCPHIGTRIRLSEIITANAPTESNTSEHYLLEDEPSPSITSHGLSEVKDVVITRCFPDFDLKTLLQTSVGGNSILQFYEANSFLNNNKRNQLTDIIVKHIYTHIVNHKISYEEYNLIAAKIISIFPKESIGTYFTNPVKKRQSITGRPVAARGKLVDKVRNLLYRYGDRKRSLSLFQDIEGPAKKKTSDHMIQESQDFLWLKTNSEPWDEVVKRWKSTFDLRKNANYANVNEFYIDWPILYDIRSDSLIAIDFDLRYPDKGLNFFMYFNDFFKKLLELKKPSNESLLNIITIIENLDEERKIPAQINIMTQLIPPKGRLNKKVKYSTQEAVDSIFILVTNAGDIDLKIKEQKLKATINKTPVQPYIILQGTLHNCLSPLLVIDNIKYSFNSISKAFDTLFKAYHVFDASYPQASNHIHLIIQRCVYKIQTKFDKVVPYIVDVLDL